MYSRPLPGFPSAPVLTTGAETVYLQYNCHYMIEIWSTPGHSWQPPEVAICTPIAGSVIMSSAMI